MPKSLNKPICPMKNAPCIKWMCAWWDEENKCCAILSLAWSLDGIASIKERAEYDRR